MKYNICRILASASIVFTNRNRPEVWIFTPHLVPFYEKSHSFSSHLEITGQKKNNVQLSVYMDVVLVCVSVAVKKVAKL